MIWQKLQRGSLGLRLLPVFSAYVLCSLHAVTEKKTCTSNQNELASYPKHQGFFMTTGSILNLSLPWFYHL